VALTIRKRGKHWFARGTVPFRQADGKIARVRIEESTHETGKVAAARAADRLWEFYSEQAYRPKPKPSPTFTDAAITYVESKNPSKRNRQLLAKLVAHFGETPIDQIDQAAVAEAAHRIYAGATPSTHVRAVFAPVTTVLRLSGVKPDFKRPRIDNTPKQVPPDDFYDHVLRVADNRLAALIIFLTLTGRRIGDALQAIDNGDGTATIGRTKTGSSVVCVVPDLVKSLLANDCVAGAGWGSRLFPYGSTRTVYRHLHNACERAGVPYYGTHALGRHAFATRLLKQGKSLKFVQEAGGWKNIKVPASHYLHLEQSDVQDEVKKIGDQWSKNRNGDRSEPENTK
jgi:integrase